MIKDEIKNPDRLGTTDSIISGKYGDAVFGIRKVAMMNG